MIIYNRKKFFKGLREFAGGRLSATQVKGAEAILDEWEHKNPSGDYRQLAYILATAWHETGGRLEPVRETFAESDEVAIRRLRTRKYAKVDPETGKAYFGRGFVQLTWKDNYRKMSKVVGVDLVNNPDLALDPHISAKILIDGMLAGLFTGKPLGRYIKGNKVDYVNARRVVNGLDRAKKIARYARKLERILKDSMEDTVTRVYDQHRVDNSWITKVIKFLIEFLQKLLEKRY